MFRISVTDCFDQCLATGNTAADSLTCPLRIYFGEETAHHTERQSLTSTSRADQSDPETAVVSVLVDLRIVTLPDDVRKA